jgi:hypothetical protein
MEWVDYDHMEHIGNTKIKKCPHLETKTIGAYWVYGDWLH